MQANVEYSQGDWAQIPTQAMCKHGNLVVNLDAKAGIQLEVKTSTFIYTSRYIVVNEGWIQLPVCRHLTTFIIICPTWLPAAT